jgi:integrase
MTTARSAAPTVIEMPSTENRQRDWFLRDSKWEDPRWVFEPTNLLEEEARLQILWDFRLPSGRRFTDPAYASLRETTKQLIATVRTRSLFTGLPQRARTAIGHFFSVRPLLIWMDREGYSRFEQLDIEAILKFRHVLAERKGAHGNYVTPNTLSEHYDVLSYLYRLRDELGDGLLVDPFVGRSPRQLAGALGGASYGKHTPDAIAVPLIQRSIEFLEMGAIDVLRAREAYGVAMADALTRIRKNPNCNIPVLDAIGTIPIHTPRGIQRIFRIQDLSDLIDMLYAACFVVIAYLVGPRVSEILHLRAGCVETRAQPGMDGGTSVEVITGTIFKRDSGYYGRSHEWVIPRVAIHAVSVLEALSAPNRARTGHDDLWLRARTKTRSMGATEWQLVPTGRFPSRIISDTAITHTLHRYTRWLNLPLADGKRWRLTAREGRKTFARFAALRDRTCLHALAQHMGHRERAMTDTGYAGTDYALEREIRTEVLEQSVVAWEHMLSTPELGGRAGREILARRPQFRGARMKSELKSYARALVEGGLILGICDYGYCVYRQPYSACRGTLSGPNPVYREPSTCARCLNFAVSSPHRPYWLEQSRRCEELLKEPALPTQTLKIARDRLEEARSVVRSIDAAGRDDDAS